MLKEPAPKLPLEQLEANFADINPPLSQGQALEEGSRCLFCQDAPCIKACPTGIDVPQFIRQILTGNLRGSAKTILEANILGQSCARVCPTSVLCEGVCVLNAEGKKPVEIGKLQRYAVDPVIASGAQLFKAAPANGYKVALIGAGPASLACAAELRKLGYETVIFDSKPQPGGLNTYGIAAYKMRAPEAVKEIEMIRALGVEIRNGITIGTDITIPELERDYDAIFIGIGLGETEDMHIPGEELDMVYRRGPEEMTAFDYEYELAKHDGVNFVWQAMPVRIVGNGRVEALECVRTQRSSKDTRGRYNYVPVPGSEFTLDVGLVIKALGQKRKLDFLKQIPN